MLIFILFYSEYINFGLWVFNYIYIYIFLKKSKHVNLLIQVNNYITSEKRKKGGYKHEDQILDLMPITWNSYKCYHWISGVIGDFDLHL